MKLDKASLAAVLKLPSDVKKAVTRAYQNAGDVGLRSLITTSQKKVQSKKLLSSAYVRAALVPIRPPQGSDFSKLVWRMRVVGKSIPLVQYPHGKGTKKGLRVRIGPGKTAMLKHAFVGYGGTAILMRVGKERGPLRQLYSTRITTVLAPFTAELQAQAQATMRAAFDAGLGVQLAKLAVGNAVKGR